VLRNTYANLPEDYLVRSKPVVEEIAIIHNNAAHH
jgi:hypothetical protein